MAISQGHAPFNFIGFEDTVLARYQSVSDLPQQQVDNKGTLKGEIEYEVTLETPTIVVGSKTKDSVATIKTFNQNTNGDYVLQGSTMRGLLRNNMQILGLGNVSGDIEDKYLLTRSLAVASKKLRTAYNEKVGISANTFGAQNVKAGYIYKKDRDTYAIIPAQSIDGNTYFRVKETDLIKNKVRGVNYYKDARNAFSYKPYVIDINYEYNLQVKRVVNVGSGDKRGKLLGSGFIRNDKNTRVFRHEMNWRDIVSI